MGSKSSPASPDYTAAAREQAAASKELTAQQNWANRPTQNTPWGKTSWSTSQTIDPGTGTPITQWTQNQTLDPRLQSALDQQLALQGQRSNLAGSFMGRVASDFNQPFNWGAMPKMEQPIHPVAIAPLDPQTSVAQQTLDTSAPTQTTTAGQQQIPVVGQDTSGLAARTTGYESIAPTTATATQPGFVQERARIEQAAMERMQPEHARQQQQLDTQLANQGITKGSEAYKQEMQRLGDQQSRERFNALQYGGEEQQRLQGMLMGQQQQAFGQQEAAGQFGLGAQQQAFGQAATSQAQRNAALAEWQRQQLGVGQFGMGQQQQAFEQDVAGQQAQNAARNQQFQQALAAGQFGNQGLQQMFQQRFDANAQNYNQYIQMQQMQNQVRQQAIAEEAMRRNMSLNEMNALLTGQQVQSPNMPGFNTANRSDAPDLLGAANMQGQANQAAFNAQQQGSQGMMSGLMGLGSTAMMF